MDPALLREREQFKRKAMALPSVENKKKKVEKPTQNEEVKQKKRSSFAAPKIDATNYKTMTGSSKYKFSVLAKIVRHMQTRHLEGEDHPLSLDEILDETQQLDVTASIKMWLEKEALISNPKIEVSPEGSFSYKPVYKLRDRKTFLKLLRQYDLKGLGGLSLRDIQESLPNAEKILKQLSNDILFIQGQDKDKILFYNDRSAQFVADDEFIKLWRLVPVDIDDEKIEEYLEKQGMRSMMDTTSRKVAQPMKRKKAVPKKRTNRKARDNQHLDDVLVTYEEGK